MTSQIRFIAFTISMVVLLGCSCDPKAQSCGQSGANGGGPTGGAPTNANYVPGPYAPLEGTWQSDLCQDAGGGLFQKNTVTFQGGALTLFRMANYSDAGCLNPTGGAISLPTLPTYAIGPQYSAQPGALLVNFRDSGANTVYPFGRYNFFKIDGGTTLTFGSIGFPQTGETPTSIPTGFDSIHYLKQP